MQVIQVSIHSLTMSALVGIKSMMTSTTICRSDPTARNWTKFAHDVKLDEIRTRHDVWCFSAIRDHLGKKMCFSIFFDIFTFWDLVLIIDWGSYPNQLRFPRVKEESLYFPPYMYIIFIVYETVFQSINQESNFWLIWFNLLIKNPIFPPYMSCFWGDYNDNVVDDLEISKQCPLHNSEKSTIRYSIMEFSYL